MRAYSHESYRELLDERGIDHTSPGCRDQRERRVRRGEDPPSFDVELYRRRNVVERCVNKLKQWLAIATRYDKRATNYRASHGRRRSDDLVDLMNRQTAPSTAATLLLNCGMLLL